MNEECSKEMQAQTWFHSAKQWEEWRISSVVEGRYSCGCPNFSQTHIDAMVDGGVRVGKWHLTGFYSNLDTRKRPESWSKLKHLKGTLILPWLTIGDFNELTSLSKNEGIAICRGGPKLSHLFLADDSLIFCKASLTECNSLQRVLHIYEQASGQQLNRTKTSLFFSKNTLGDVQEEIKTRFGAQVIKQHKRYLGLPSLIGRNKQSTFKSIKEKLGKKPAGWKEKMLSKAGKEILIKAVVQAIPTYTMSCFKLHDSLCEDLTSMIQNFWWGQKKDEKKIVWLS